MSYEENFIYDWLGLWLMQRMKDRRSNSHFLIKIPSHYGQNQQKRMRKLNVPAFVLLCRAQACLCKGLFLTFCPIVGTSSSVSNIIQYKGQHIDCGRETSSILWNAGSIAWCTLVCPSLKRDQHANLAISLNPVLNGVHQPWHSSFYVILWSKYDQSMTGTHQIEDEHTTWFPNHHSYLKWFQLSTFLTHSLPFALNLFKIHLPKSQTLSNPSKLRTKFKKRGIFISKWR